MAGSPSPGRSSATTAAGSPGPILAVHFFLPRTPGPAPWYGGGGLSAAVALPPDALNAIVHTVWRTGIIELSSDGRNPKPGGLAAKAGLLYPFFPAVRAAERDCGFKLVWGMR